MNRRSRVQTHLAVTQLGDIIYPRGRPERVIEREMIYHRDTGAPFYVALRSEPVEAAPASETAAAPA